MLFVLFACETSPQTACERACDVVWTTCAPDVEPSDVATWASPDDLPGEAEACKEECAIAVDQAPSLAADWTACVDSARSAVMEFDPPDDDACRDAYACSIHPCRDAQLLYDYKRTTNGDTSAYECDPG